MFSCKKSLTDCENIFWDSMVNFLKYQDLINFFSLFWHFSVLFVKKKKMAEDIQRAKDLAFAKAAKYISSCLTVSLKVTKMFA